MDLFLFYLFCSIFIYLGTRSDFQYTPQMQALGFSNRWDLQAQLETKAYYFYGWQFNAIVDGVNTLNSMNQALKVTGFPYARTLQNSDSLRDAWVFITFDEAQFIVDHTVLGAYNDAHGLSTPPVEEPIRVELAQADGLLSHDELKQGLFERGLCIMFGLCCGIWAIHLAC